jgi:DNA-binding NarL/FixJ family response regulator
MLAYPEGNRQITYGFRVVVCDAHPQMRAGVRNVLTAMLGCEVVGEAATGEDAIAMIERYTPDMLVLDLSLPGKLNGRETLSELRRKRLPVKVFVHTANLNRADFEGWLNDHEGPDGMEEKIASDRELALGFAQVLITEQKYVPLRLFRKFMDRSWTQAIDRLTLKESVVFNLAVRPELDTLGIARKLGYSPSTVRSYLTTIYAKLGLEQHNRAALMAFYYSHRDEALLDREHAT